MATQSRGHGTQRNHALDDLHVPWVFVAVSRERLFLRPKILRTLHPNIHVAEFDGCAFVLAETGMGAERVRAALDRIAGRCSRALFAGFAGGLRPELAIGDIVWAEEVVGDGTRYRPTEPSPANARRGVLWSSDRIVSTPAEKRALAERDGDVVDMESATFAAWCVEHRIPWQCVRAVSDRVDDSLPADLFDVLGDSHVSPVRLIRALIRRPSLVGDLWTLEHSTRSAARALAAGIRTWILPLNSEIPEKK
jgi:nucleoside phosphorylase